MNEVILARRPSTMLAVLAFLVVTVVALLALPGADSEYYSSFTPRQLRRLPAGLLFIRLVAGGALVTAGFGLWRWAKLGLDLMKLSTPGMLTILPAARTGISPSPLEFEVAPGEHIAVVQEQTGLPRQAAISITTARQAARIHVLQSEIPLDFHWKLHHWARISEVELSFTH